MATFRDFLKRVTPILVSPKDESLSISLSKRFFLFQLMNNIVRTIEEDTHSNFIALLKSYKVLGRILHGKLEEFYKDRNKLYFKKFFMDNHLYKLVKEDIESLYPDHKDLLMTITKRGVMIYENYKKNSFNVLLLTMHSGTWIPDIIKKKLSIDDKKRYTEEDIDTDKLYRRLVLEKGGVWIDNKQSRFVVDFNRALEKAIYANNSEEWLDIVWKEDLTKPEADDIYKSYREFYFTLTRLLETYNFNIIFDGHSMKSLEGRPNISFGTKYIPKFYMPIVRSMQRKLISMGYSPVLLNTPYSGGNILNWMSIKFPNVFIFSMEVNKKIYMSKNMQKIYNKKVEKISKDLVNIFDIEEEDD